MTPATRRAIGICWGLWVRWRAAHGRWGGRRIDRPTLHALWHHIRAEHGAETEGEVE